MGWDLSVYIEGKDKDGIWRLLTRRPVLSSAKYLIDWDECGWNIKVDDCSPDLLLELYRSRKESHDGAIKYNPEIAPYTDSDWERDKGTYMLKEMDTDYILSEIEASEKFVDSAFNAVFKASGCPFTSDEQDDTDFYAGKYDSNDNVRKSWNPLTYPINKDLFYDLQSAYFKKERIGQLRMLLSVANDMAFSWMDGNEYKRGDVRFIVEYT